jgi:hypothetical protein
MLGAKLRENFQANDLALVSVLVATGATVLLDSYGHLPNIAARSIQRFLQRWRWRLAYQPPNQTPMPCTIPTGKNAASAIIRGRCPFVAQKMIEVSHAEYATASTTMIVAAVVKSIGPLEFRVIVTPAPPRLFSADGIPPARRQPAHGPMPTGNASFRWLAHDCPGDDNDTGRLSPPASSDRRSRSRSGAPWRHRDRCSRLSPHGIMPPSSNGARSSTVDLQAHHRQRYIELCVR